MISFPDKKYNIIYADPPWSYFQFKKKVNGAAIAHYNTMTFDELAELPINSIVNKEGCALFLWATNPKLSDAIKLIDKWGFRYVTVAFVWVKVSKKDGCIRTGAFGFHTYSSTEMCLLCKIGSLERKHNDVQQLIKYPIIEHSFKPPETRDRIVRLFGDLPRIELFARQRVDGWDAWGNEV